MIKVGINIESFDKRLAEMMSHLRELPVGEELTRWQVEDMKRTYPNTTVPDAVERDATTYIWPRSRTWSRTHRRSARRPKWLRPKRVRSRGAGRRPILRPVLFEMLRKRMAAMLLAELKW